MNYMTPMYELYDCFVPKKITQMKSLWKLFLLDKNNIYILTI